MGKVFITDSRVQIQGTKSDIMSYLAQFIHTLIYKDGITDEELDYVIEIAKKTDDELEKETKEKLEGMKDTLAKAKELLDKLIGDEK